MPADPCNVFSPPCTISRDRHPRRRLRTKKGVLGGCQPKTNLYQPATAFHAVDASDLSRLRSRKVLQSPGQPSPADRFTAAPCARDLRFLDACEFVVEPASPQVGEIAAEQ